MKRDPLAPPETVEKWWAEDRAAAEPVDVGRLLSDGGERSSDASLVVGGEASGMPEGDGVSEVAAVTSTGQCMARMMQARLTWRGSRRYNGAARASGIGCWLRVGYGRAPGWIGYWLWVGYGREVVRRVFRIVEENQRVAIYLWLYPDSMLSLFQACDIVDKLVVLEVRAAGRAPSGLPIEV